MKRTDIINKLVAKHNYTRYLEIGVQDYYSNCDKITTPIKHAVDPFPRNKCDYIMTSDDFFKQLDPDFKYDIVFIDGLHLTEQVDKDIENSLKHLEKDGTIVIHDCHPIYEFHQVRNDHGGEWMGDVWKSIAKFNATRPDLTINVVDTDFGCGIIQRGERKLHLKESDIQNLNWQFYQQHSQKLLNLISIDTFLNTYIN